MARGKQPPVSHALPKQQTLLDCFLEAQAKRTKRRRSAGASANAAAAPALVEDAPAADVTDQPTGLKPVQVIVNNVG